MNASTKKRCSLCGHLLEKYPNNAEPLIHGEVCLQCNVTAVILYRYFISAYQRRPIAMVIRNGNIQPSKLNSRLKRIDGTVATIVAYATLTRYKLDYKSMTNKNAGTYVKKLKNELIALCKKNLDL